MTVRIASPSELERARAAYLAWGYHGGILSTDVVFMAERGGELVGIVRRSVEHDVVMLRGMQVDPAAQRRGIGTRLLEAFVAGLDGRECFCVPFSHLVGFYGQQGFVPRVVDSAPAFLGRRIARYGREGHSVLLMVRPGRSPDRDHPAGA